MKLLHLSDLHLGKRLNKFSLLEDQRYILHRILNVAEETHPDCIIIAGDVYDKAIPPAEAVALFDSFLTELAVHDFPVCILSGNHDSAERVAFGEKIMQKSRIFISPVYNGTVTPVILHDDFGEVRFYMLPFLRPAHVRSIFPDKQISDYTDAVGTAIHAMQLDTSVRNVLIAHQFVTGAERCDSEEIYVGSTENIDAGIFSDFDYTALGHLHRPQNVGERIRYCGTPLKYSFSEVHHRKSITLVELGAKGTPLQIQTIPLTPQREMWTLHGSFDSIMQADDSDDYLGITLTDEEMIPDAIGKLRRKFPHIMMLDYDNRRTNTVNEWLHEQQTEHQTPLALFSEFFTHFNGQDMNEKQQTLIAQMIKEIWEDHQ